MEYIKSVLQISEPTYLLLNRPPASASEMPCAGGLAVLPASEGASVAGTRGVVAVPPSARGGRAIEKAAVRV